MPRIFDGASKTTRIMMATVRHVTSSSGLRKFQTDGFLFVGVYHKSHILPGNLTTTRRITTYHPQLMILFLTN